MAMAQEEEAMGPDPSETLGPAAIRNVVDFAQLRQKPKAAAPSFYQTLLRWVIRLALHTRALALAVP